MKTYLKTIVMLFLAAMLFITGCEKSSETKSKQTDDSTFTFAVVGHQWIMTYDATMPKAYDNDTVSIVSAQGTDTWLLNDGSLMLCSSNVFGIGKENDIFIVCKADALVGDTYSGVAGDCKVVAVNEDVTVPAGTFSCFKVERSISGQLRDTYYINRKYGLIKVVNDEFISILLSKNF